VLAFSFRRLRSGTIVLGLLSSVTGFLLKMVRSADGSTSPGAGDDLLAEAARIDRLPGAADACAGRRASDGCDLVLPPISIPGECARGPGHSLFCAPRPAGTTNVTPRDKEGREQSTIRW
jgi:hypothetical protein